MMRRLRSDNAVPEVFRARKRERGSASVALVFLAAAVIVGAALANLAVSVVVNLAAVNRSMMMNAAIEQRFGDYVSQTDAASQTAPTGAICYRSLNSCVTVTAVSPSGAQSTVTMRAVFGGGGQSLIRSRTVSAKSATNISGYDAAGNPVWVTVPGVTAYGG